MTEILVVLVIAAIIVTSVVAQFGRSKNKLQRQNVTRELKNDLERARFDSVKRHAADESEMSFVRINSATSFSVVTDMNQNGVVETFENRLINFSNNNIKIVGNNLEYPITIRFDDHGFSRATNGSGTAVNPYLTICDSCTLSTADSTNSNIVSVTTTGTVLMTEGGQSAPTFPTPDVTNISSSSQIKSTVVVTPTATPTTTTPCTVILILCL